MEGTHEQLDVVYKDDTGDEINLKLLNIKYIKMFKELLIGIFSEECVTSPEFAEENVGIIEDLISFQDEENHTDNVDFEFVNINEKASKIEDVNEHLVERKNSTEKHDVYSGVKHRCFTTSSESSVDDGDVEFELRSYCKQLRQFVVFDRLNENKNLHSFLTRMNAENVDEYLKRCKVSNYNNLRHLENYLNILYTFSCCGFYTNPDELKRVLDGLYSEYVGLLGGLRGTNETEDTHQSTDDTTFFSGNMNTDDSDMSTGSIKDTNEPKTAINETNSKIGRVEWLGRILALAMLSSCELGLFKDNLKKASDMIETFLFGELFELFMDKSCGKLINSTLFLYSTTQLFENGNDCEMELKYDLILRAISKNEISLELSDLYYLRLAHLFISSRMPELNKKLSKESLSFLSNVVFQDYIREKDLHGLDDIIPSKIKQINSNIEGGLFTIGLYAFTHVSLPNKSVYLLNKPNYYFNSDLSFGKREYMNWMDSFLKTSGWDLIYV
ncbi:hypothetical protein MACK_000927 [Theileria orientalis]|uniref:Uncharacterized protein n=1 Tax=Theileria orientalis TaxID=68886 RepID=A0A976QUR8_THEOR|nr:hypothetical protein MACK_000927 [Theileria orientalis]